MQLKSFTALTILGGLIGLATSEPAAADPYGYGRPAHLVGMPVSHPPGPIVRRGGRRQHPRDARMLPPAVPYRDPSADRHPRGQPDFLIHAYLPRYTDAPMYNEPPERFPQR